MIERSPPTRTTLRILTDDPRLEKSKTEHCFANREEEWIDRPDPKVAQLRRDIDDARCTKFRELRPPFTLTYDLTDRDDPKEAKLNTDNVVPIGNIFARIDVLLPKRAKLRIERDDPH
jgi:hypothetical protein